MEENVAIFVNRKKKATTKAELEKFTKDELIERVVQLEKHTQQLKNIIKKELVSTNAGTDDTQMDDNNQRKFDFANCHRRHVLLKLYYLGWDYQGFTTQENSGNTIEHHLFAALRKTCLIASRETSNYHRCGRTDKGVSAFSQVISIDLRSKYPPEQQMTDDAIQNELRYCESLNRVLPQDIRCVAWQPLRNSEFSARFDCRERTYRYFFPRSNLDIGAMQEACTYLVGNHDFRNLCKMDVGNGVVTFERAIRNARIVLSTNSAAHASEESAYDMFYFELTGKAFLWHQVRCIVAILLLVGQHNEKPEIVRQLLDVETNPCTPQYSLASDIPLNLFNVEYDEISTNTVTTGDAQAENIGWMYDSVNLSRVIGLLQEQWTKLSVKSQMMLEMLHVLEDIYQQRFNESPIFRHADALQEGVKSRTYQTLMSRTKCSSLENRIAHYAKKRRIEIVHKDELDARKTRIVATNDDDGNE